jgi:hypothetical protein
MTVANKIKIDSFTIEKMRQTDVNEALRLAIIAQSSFGITDAKSPLLFLNQIKGLILDNIENSYVYRSDLDKVFGILIIKPQTTISAEFALFVSDPEIIQTDEMYQAFIDLANSLKFKTLFARVYKRRKKFEAYVRLLGVYGFTEILNEDEDFLTIGFKKA